MGSRLALIAAVLLALAPPAASAQPRGQEQEQAQGQEQGQKQAARPGQREPARNAKRPAQTAPLPAEVTSRHTVTLPGGPLAYTATAGALTLRDANGDRKADIAFTYYAVEPKNGRPRPVTFAFNGGPGAASAYLHLGVLGPKRIAFGNADGSPSRIEPLVDNAETWLAFTDLVFVDPVGTGWSQAAQETEEGRKPFWNVRGDIEWLSRFVAQWLQVRNRLGAPVYLAGESYGGFRVPRIAHRLQTVEGVGVAGIVMISPVLDFGLRRNRRNSPMGWVTLLPSLAAAAIERSGGTASGEALAEAERYAMGDYLVDLVRGPRDAAAVDRMVARVTRLTGLDAALVRRLGGRVDAETFVRELYRDQGRVGSRYDVGVTGFDPYPTEAEGEWDDPILIGSIAPLTTAIVTYTRDVLGWHPPGRYRLLNNEVSRAWDWGEARGQPADASDDLRQALALDPAMRALIVHGASDVVTPYFASRLIANQIPAFGDPGRLAFQVYPGGHMFYTRDASRAAFLADVRRLYP